MSYDKRSNLARTFSGARFATTRWLETGSGVGRKVYYLTHAYSSSSLDVADFAFLVQAIDVPGLGGSRFPEAATYALRTLGNALHAQPKKFQVQLQGVALDLVSRSVSWLYGPDEFKAEAADLFLTHALPLIVQPLPPHLARAIDGWLLTAQPGQPRFDLKQSLQHQRPPALQQRLDERVGIEL